MAIYRVFVVREKKGYSIQEDDLEDFIRVYYPTRDAREDADGDLYFRRLREIREEAGDTQEQTAGFLGVSRSGYLEYEQGRRKMPISILMKFCIHYCISADYILELTDYKLSVD